MEEFKSMSLIRRRLSSLVLVAMVVALLAAVFSVSAQAGTWSGSNPAYTWTTGNGVYYTYSWESVENTSEAKYESICVSPVQWNGSKYVFPWGWQCKGYSVYFPHSTITAAHGVYNPNGTRQYFFAQFG
jgi:hypothetical protein